MTLPRRRLTLALLSGALACGGGGGTPPAETAPAPAAAMEAAPVAVETGAPPSFEASATGNGWVDGAAAAATSTRYFREVSGTRGQPFDLKGEATGDEKSKACGTDWRASSARSVVLVTPEAARGSVGFTLNATATARRGFWRTKATLSCTTLNYTDAQAATMARGQAWITLGGGPTDRDQLVIETSGATTGEWALSVTDSAGNKVTPSQVGSTLLAAVPGAGRYSVAASVTARASSVGVKDSAEQRLRATVRASSLRNAVAAAIGRAPLRNLDAPFFIETPTPDLAGPMQASLAGYRPCIAKPGCAGKVSDVNVSSLTVTAENGGASIVMTVVGAKRAPVPVKLVSAVTVAADSLRLSDVRLAGGQPAVLKKRDLTEAVQQFIKRISGVSAPLGPRRAAAEASVRAHFPVHVGDLCAEASSAPASFLGTIPAPDASAFQAVFGVSLSPLQPCARPR